MCLSIIEIINVQSYLIGRNIDISNLHDKRYTPAIPLPSLSEYICRWRHMLFPCTSILFEPLPLNYNPWPKDAEFWRHVFCDFCFTRLFHCLLRFSGLSLALSASYPPAWEEHGRWATSVYLIAFIVISDRMSIWHSLIAIILKLQRHHKEIPGFSMASSKH